MLVIRTKYDEEGLPVFLRISNKKNGIEYQVDAVFKDRRVDPEVIEARRRYLISGLVALIGSRRWIDTWQPDILMVISGRHTRARVGLTGLDAAIATLASRRLTRRLGEVRQTIAALLVE